MSVVGVLGKSSEIVKTMTSVAQLGEARKVIQSLENEMIVAGLVNESVTQAMDDINPVASEDVDAEMNHVLWEVSNGSLGVRMQAAAVPAEQQAAAAAKQQETQRLMAMALGGGGS